MNKFKIFMLIFSLFLSIISEPLLAVTGFVSVSSGVNISASPVVRGNNFSISFTLLERNGQSKTFENVAIAILDPSGNFIFDFATWGNITVAAKGTKPLSATSSIFTNRPTGTYKAVIRGKYAGSWFNFDAVGSGVTPKAFAVVAANQPPPPPPPPAIPLAPTLKTPANTQPNVPKANVNFSWDASARATSYRIVVSQNQSFSGFNPSNLTCDGTCGTDKITGTSQTRNLLLDGTTYHWKVNASNATGASGWSVVRSFTTAGVNYAQSRWNEALRAYNNGERKFYKGYQLVDTKYTYCARHVRLVHDKPSKAGYDTAAGMCQNYAKKGLINKSGTPPVGASVCYTDKTPYTNGAGHIAIAQGNGQELGVTNLKNGVSLRTSPTNQPYYWGWIKADDFKNNY